MAKDKYSDYDITWVYQAIESHVTWLYTQA